MDIDEYLTDLHLIRKTMRPAGYTYIAAGIPIGIVVALMLVWLFS